MSEKDFKEEIVKFSDEHFNLAAAIWSTFGNYGSFIVSEDKKALCFAIDKGKDRLEKENGSHRYIVRIEKI